MNTIIANIYVKNYCSILLQDITSYQGSRNNWKEHLILNDYFKINEHTQLHAV